MIIETKLLIESRLILILENMRELDSWNKSRKWIEWTRKIIHQMKGLSDARKHIKLINQFHVL